MLSSAEKLSYEVWTVNPSDYQVSKNSGTKFLSDYARLAVFRERMTTGRDALTRARDYITCLPETDRPYAFIVKVEREVIA